MIAIALIHRIYYAKGRGVICLDARQRPVLWIAEEDPELAIQARDILVELVRSKGRSGQPDWSFLKRGKDKPRQEKVNKV